MRYFIDENNNLRFSDNDKYIQDTWTEITEDEFNNPTKTEEQIKSDIKEAKKLALDSITVTTSNGNTFDGNETARINMVSAIAVADIAGITEKEWKLADNSIKVITLNELKEALLLSIQKVGDIVL